jgi:hypothetical protein
MAKHHNLFDQDVLFALDLPCYIIPAVLRILWADQCDESPNLDWLPGPTRHLRLWQFRHFTHFLASLTQVKQTITYLK